MCSPPMRLHCCQSLLALVTFANRSSEFVSETFQKLLKCFRVILNLESNYLIILKPRMKYVLLIVVVSRRFEREEVGKYYWTGRW